VSQRVTAGGARARSGRPSSALVGGANYHLLSPVQSRRRHRSHTGSTAVNLPRHADTNWGGRFERIGMSDFDADDVKVYKGWLRRTLAVYACILLLGAATIAAFALTQGPNSHRILATVLSPSTH
jgi:hypothetical protein